MIRVLILAILFTLSVLDKGVAQDYSAEDKTLTELRASDDLVPYFKKIKILGDSAYQKKDQARLSDLGNILKSSFDTLSFLEKK